MCTRHILTDTCSVNHATWIVNDVPVFEIALQIIVVGEEQASAADSGQCEDMRIVGTDVLCFQDSCLIVHRCVTNLASSTELDSRLKPYLEPTIFAELPPESATYHQRAARAV